MSLTHLRGNTYTHCVCVLTPDICYFFLQSTLIHIKSFLSPETRLELALLSILPSLPFSFLPSHQNSLSASIFDLHLI